MKLSEIVTYAITHANFKENQKGLNELLFYAYKLGRSHASVNCCEKAEEIFSEQLKRVGKSPDPKMALEIQGDIKTLNPDDYSKNFIDACEDNEMPYDLIESLDKIYRFMTRR